jgi:ABC-2 type transport system ATP-binding protein
MEAVFRECVEEERQQGRTVLLSSHILAEVEALCDRITIIRNGRTVETGTLSEIRHLTRTRMTADLAWSGSGLQDMPGVHNLQVHDHRVEFEADPEVLPQLLAKLVQLGVVNLTSRPPTLEELFLRHYEVDAPP